MAEGNERPPGRRGGPEAPPHTGDAPVEDPTPAAPALSPEQLELAFAQVYGGREVVTVALLVVLGCFAVTLVAFREGAAVAAAMGSVTTVIGTLVGSYFGFQAGNQGRERATDAALTASRTAVTAAAFVPEAKTSAFLDRVREASADSTLNGNPRASDF